MVYWRIWSWLKKWSWYFFPIGTSRSFSMTKFFSIKLIRLSGIMNWRWMRQNSFSGSNCSTLQSGWLIAKWKESVLTRQQLREDSISIISLILTRLSLFRWGIKKSYWYIRAVLVKKLYDSKITKPICLKATVKTPIFKSRLGNTSLNWTEQE